MKTIQEVEEAIVTRLRETIDGISIEKTGKEPAKFKPDHPKGSVLVYFIGSTFYIPSNYRDLEQKVSYQFAVSVFVKELHGNDGAYSLLEQVRETLSGHKIFKNKLLPLSTRLVSSRKGLWHYETKFELCLPS